MKTSDGEHEGSEIHIHGGKLVQQGPAEIRRALQLKSMSCF